MSLRMETSLPPKVERLISRVIGAAIEVHRHLGPGFLESIYEQALCQELTERGISCARQREVSVFYKDAEIRGQRLDLIVDDSLIVELKTVESVLPIHQAQLLSYLKTTGLRVGLIINFNTLRLRDGIKRMVL